MVDHQNDEHRERLIELRDQLHAALQLSSENMLPQIAGRYQAVLTALHELDAERPSRVTVQDELKARRRARRQKKA